jgi:hypothetical protein
MISKSTMLRAAVAGLALAGTIAATSEASAGWRCGPYGCVKRGGWNPGAAAAVGAVGGLALGAAIANSRPYYGPAPVYAPPPPPPPVYPAYPAYGYGPGYGGYEPVGTTECTTVTKRIWVPGYGWDYRRSTSCY